MTDVEGVAADQEVADPIVAEAPIEAPAEETVPAGESEPVADVPADAAASDQDVENVVPAPVVPAPANFRIEWIDGGGGAKSVSLGSSDIALGFIVGLMQDGRNRDAVMIDESGGAMKLARSRDEAWSLLQ